MTGQERAALGRRAAVLAALDKAALAVSCRICRADVGFRCSSLVDGRERGWSHETRKHDAGQAEADRLTRLLVAIAYPELDHLITEDREAEWLAALDRLSERTPS